MLELKIIFLISQPKHMLWVLKRTVSMRQSFEHAKHMFRLKDKERNTILPSKVCLAGPMPHCVYIVLIGITSHNFQA